MSDLITMGQAPQPSYKQDVYRVIDRPHVGYSSDLRLWKIEYRGFGICRMDEQNTLYEIKPLNETPTPLRLRGSFTNTVRAEREIDKYLAVVSRENG